LSSVCIVDDRDEAHCFSLLSARAMSAAREYVHCSASEISVSFGIRWS
jgi:hypothetical protein